MHKIYVDSYLIISNAVYLNLMKLNTKKNLCTNMRSIENSKKRKFKIIQFGIS